MTRTDRAIPPVLLRLFTACGVCFLALAAAAQGQSTLAIRNVTVVDVRDGSLLAGQTVLVADNRIAAVGRADALAVPEGAQVVDARGKYLIPGLWDMHAHVLFEGMDGFFALLVANGVTGIRDMGDSPMPLAEIRRVRTEIRAGERIGPRFIAPGVLVDGPDSRWEDGVALAGSPERGRAIVDSLAAEGADFIKVYSYLRPEVYRAIVEQAQTRRIPVVGHVPYLVPAAEASDAGQRSFEHMIGIEQGCSTDEQALIEISRLELAAIARADTARADELEREWRRRTLATQEPTRCRALLERLARNRTWQVPTLVQQGRPECWDAEALARDPRLKYVPAFLRASWPDILMDARGRDLKAEREMCRVRRAIAAEMARLGVPLLAGSDTPWPFVIPGFSLHEELELLVEAGLTRLAALQAATLDAARFLEATDSLGTVEPDKLADLVLLEANPLEDIANTQRVSGVVLNGRYLDRQALDALLQSAERSARQAATESPADAQRAPPELPDGWTVANAQELGLDPLPSGSWARPATATSGGTTGSGRLGVRAPAGDDVEVLLSVRRRSRVLARLVRSTTGDAHSPGLSRRIN